MKDKVMKSVSQGIISYVSSLIQETTSTICTNQVKMKWEKDYMLKILTENDLDCSGVKMIEDLTVGQLLNANKRA